MSHPTLFVTNWSSKRLHGAGRRLTIMAQPRAWEVGDGRVPALTPPVGWLAAVRSGGIDLAEYRRRMEDRLQTGLPLQSGRLHALVDGRSVDVVDGDTLCCACSVDDAKAGKCHRQWSAHALVRAGWWVVLDGVEIRRVIVGVDVDHVSLNADGSLGLGGRVR